MGVRRGPLSYGERVQLTDKKGRLLTVMLSPNGVTQTDRGFLPHDDMVGLPEGSVITSISASAWHDRHVGDDADTGGSAPAERDRAKPWKSARAIGGWQYTVMRPRLEDFILSMPRGAQIMYPKDIAQVISLGDVRHGMRVLESGAGSGAMSLGLLDAVGPDGSLTTIEVRPEFARVAMGNATVYYGNRPAWWNLLVGDFDTRAAGLDEGYFDRIVLDMLDPWNRLDAAYRVLAPGGVLTAYITTTTQMSRMVESLRRSGHWTEPEIQETMERSWKADGLAVRPEHQMIGHTGFLVVARAMAPGQTALQKKIRATKDYTTDIDQVQETRKDDQDLDSLELRDISDRKLRKVLRDLDKEIGTMDQYLGPTEERSDS